MTDRSTPISLLEKEYQFRITRADLKALESALGIGYLHFFQRGISGSFTAIEAFLWRGLRVTNKSGELEYMFSQTDDGRDAAGEFLWNFLAKDGDIGHLTVQIAEGFVASGVYGTPKAGGGGQEPDTGKNPISTG